MPPQLTEICNHLMPTCLSFWFSFFSRYVIRDPLQYTHAHSKNEIYRISIDISPDTCTADTCTAVLLSIYLCYLAFAFETLHYPWTPS